MAIALNETPPLPMMNNMSVSYYNRETKSHVKVPLNEAPQHQLVSVSGIIIEVLRPDGNTLGRTDLVISDENGNTVTLRLNPNVVMVTEPILRRNSIVSAYGLIILFEETRFIEGLGVSPMKRKP